MRSFNGGTTSPVIANPHFVQLPVPERGFGSDLNAMVEFILEHGEELRIGCSKRELTTGTAYFFASGIRTMRPTSPGGFAERSLTYPQMMIFSSHEKCEGLERQVRY